jgi:hypothetical protein
VYVVLNKSFELKLFTSVKLFVTSTSLKNIQILPKLGTGFLNNFFETYPVSISLIVC